MTKVVINNCYGGFNLSSKAVRRYAELKRMSIFPFVEDKPFGGKMTQISWEDVEEKEKSGKWFPIIHYYTSEEPARENYFYEGDIPRDDPALVKTVQELGDESFGDVSKLEIVDVPDDVEWEIEEYDGNEWVSEKHRRWS